ncbi:MAG: DUF2752 domain-containing protein, partial [Bacilli bacterium]|nr:DUF2752 domain-containing protein [Bacilli bacterium]
MQKRIRSFLVIILTIFLFLFLYYGDFDCLFKKYLGIICPGCGMSRAVDEIFRLHFISSFKYNILALPLLIVGVLLIIGFVYDFI